MTRILPVVLLVVACGEGINPPQRWEGRTACGLEVYDLDVDAVQRLETRTLELAGELPEMTGRDLCADLAGWSVRQRAPSPGYCPPGMFWDPSIPSDKPEPDYCWWGATWPMWRRIDVTSPIIALPHELLHVLDRDKRGGHADWESRQFNRISREALLP